MFGIDGLDEADDGTVFRDVIMLALAGFVAIVILLLPHLNPPAKADDAPPPGNVVVEIYWPDDVNVDVDLWVEAPGDRPVGYSNKGGQVFNLLRDDLGYVGDLTSRNYEISYSRGVPAGDYTVNVHLYRNNVNIYPVPVSVIASVKRDGNGTMKRIVATDVEMHRQGEELTAFRFTLDERGQLLSGSVHALYRPLRAPAS